MSTASRDGDACIKLCEEILADQLDLKLRKA
jgi:hypothetical protein